MLCVISLFVSNIGTYKFDSFVNRALNLKTETHFPEDQRLLTVLLKKSSCR